MTTTKKRTPAQVWGVLAAVLLPVLLLVTLTAMR